MCVCLCVFARMGVVEIFTRCSSGLYWSIIMKVCASCMDLCMEDEGIGRPGVLLHASMSVSVTMLTFALKRESTCSCLMIKNQTIYTALILLAYVKRSVEK
jgi:hypothetical protein